MQDIYTYKNGVLKNKLNITSYDELNKAEADIGFSKLVNIDLLDEQLQEEELIKKIHKHIFDEIFDWAGEYRKVSIEKMELVLPGCSILYSEPKKIKSDLKNRLILLNSHNWQNMNIDELSKVFARELALLWRVHPFRDGNTRTTLSFAYIYAQKNNFPFDIATFIQELNRTYDNGRVTKYSIRDKFVLACLDEKDYPEVEYLASAFANAINKRKINESQKNNISK